MHSQRFFSDRKVCFGTKFQSSRSSLGEWLGVALLLLFCLTISNRSLNCICSNNPRLADTLRVIASKYMYLTTDNSGFRAILHSSYYTTDFDISHFARNMSVDVDALVTPNLLLNCSPETRMYIVRVFDSRFAEFSR